MIGTVLEVLGVVLIALGIAMTTITVYGVVRLSGLYPRLQAAGKGPMLGTVAILAASIGTKDLSTIGRALLVAVFLLFTTPVAAHVIAQAAHRRDGSDGGASGEDEG